MNDDNAGLLPSPSLPRLESLRSLSSLLSQGFDEGPARQALRKFQNNTQVLPDFGHKFEMETSLV